MNWPLHMPRLYDLRRWRRFSKLFLQANPFCKLCSDVGHSVPATQVDHVKPHRGDPAKFWAGPFQSLCDTCHGSAKQAQERGSGLRGATADGLSVDPAHHWHRGSCAPAAG